jgi:hypothetical protein
VVTPTFSVPTTVPLNNPVNRTGITPVDGGSVVLPPADIPADAISYDVSPATGAVAYITANGDLLINGQVFTNNGKHTNQDFVQVRWSPDGRTLAYIVQTPGAAERGASPTEAPDDGVWFVSGGEAQHIFRSYYVQGSNEYPYRVAYALHWSPDNTRMLVAVQRQNGYPALILTSTERRVFENASGLFDLLPYTDPVWLPGSNNEFYAMTSEPFPTFGIFRWDGIGGDSTRDREFTPLFSAPGFWIQDGIVLLDGSYAFLGKPASGRDPFGLSLYTTTPGGTPVQRSVPLPGEVIGAEWSPNRSALLVRLNVGGTITTRIVYLDGSITPLETVGRDVHWAAQ